MTLGTIVDSLHLTVWCGETQLERPVTGGYVGDLLSDVMAHSAAGEVWITMQAHVNTVAVAVLKELAAIILVNGRMPDTDTLQRARDEHVPILSGPQAAFEMAGRLYALKRGAGA